MNIRDHHSPKPRRSKDREIARLHSELASERSRSAKLEREITRLKQELKDHDHAQARQPIRRLRRRSGSRRQEDKLLDKANRHARYYRKSSFLRYLVDAFKESAFMHFIKKFIRYLKRFQLVQTAIPILLAVGAVVTVAIVSPLAVLILCAAIILPTAFVLLCFHRANRLFRKALTGCRIRILIPSGKEALAPGSFFIRNALDMAAEDKVTVIVVTPRPVSNRGLGGRGAFFTARKEAPTLFLVRRHYFFTFRRKVLDRLDGEVTMIF